MHMYICMSLPCRAAAHVLTDHIAEPEPGAARARGRGSVRGRASRKPDAAREKQSTARMTAFMFCKLPPGSDVLHPLLLPERVRHRSKK